MSTNNSKPKGGIKVAGDEQKMTVISIKMTTDFRDWLAGLADAERITTVQLIERSVVEHAERRNHPDPAPRRTGRK